MMIGTYEEFSSIVVNAELVFAHIYRPFKAQSHLPQRSVDSAVDCINAEMEHFLSVCGNATVHSTIRTSVNETFR